jgi:predicted MPP superfamily phosphohydrolase
MELVMILAWIVAVAWPGAAALAAMQPSWRRSWLARGLAAAATVLWAGVCWAFLVEPELLFVRQVRVESAAWKGAPVRLGVISDIHVGNPHMSADRVARIVDRMNGLHPDLVLLVGDYISGHLKPDERTPEQNRTIDQGIAALGRLEAPLGTIAVLGNHDWWYDGPRVEKSLRDAGVTVLENAAQEVDAPEERFWVAGLADFDSTRAKPDWKKALAAAPAGADVIGLGHWPDVFGVMVKRASLTPLPKAAGLAGLGGAETPTATPAGGIPFVALTVAGHTHCGQINIPLLGRIPISPAAARWPCGLYEEQGRFLYVTGGVGLSGIPARFRAPPEIAVITLSGRRAESD